MKTLEEEKKKEKRKEKKKKNPIPQGKSSRELSNGVKFFTLCNRVVVSTQTGHQLVSQSAMAFHPIASLFDIEADQISALRQRLPI